MIHIVAENFIKEEKIAEFKEMVKELISETRKEEGCIEYSLVVNRDDSTSFTFIEKWESMEHVGAHMKSAHFTKIAPMIGEIVAKEGSIKLFNDLD